MSISWWNFIIYNGIERQYVNISHNPVSFQWIMLANTNCLRLDVFSRFWFGYGRHSSRGNLGQAIWNCLFTWNILIRLTMRLDVNCQLWCVVVTLGQRLFTWDIILRLWIWWNVICLIWRLLLPLGKWLFVWDIGLSFWILLEFIYFICSGCPLVISSGSGSDGV